MKYVVFTGSEDCEQGHVCILDKIDGEWYFINPLSYQINLLTKVVKAKNVEYMLNKYEHYKIDDNLFKPQRYLTGSYLFLSCVSVVKFYLGIKNLFIFTPKHLRLFLQGKPVTLLNKIARSFECVKLLVQMALQRLGIIHGKYY